MIEEPPLLTISRNFRRPDEDVLKPFLAANSCWAADAQNGRGALDRSIRRIGGGRGLVCGPAVTCYCGPNDNLGLFAALSLVRPGDIVVAAADGFAGSALCGDLLAGMLRNCGAAALVTDGMVRDLAGLEEMGLPVFAAGLTPNSCVKTGPATAGLPVHLGGRRVASGDLVLADEDGVVIVPQNDIAATAHRLEQIAIAEAGLLEKVRGGLRIPPAIEELLASDRTVRID